MMGTIQHGTTVGQQQCYRANGVRCEHCRWVLATMQELRRMDPAKLAKDVEWVRLHDRALAILGQRHRDELAAIKREIRLADREAVSA
jgi:hypothetical protein